MSSSPLSSGLSTPQKMITKEVDEDMEEEPEQEEEELASEDLEENEEDDEMEDVIQDETVKESDPQLSKQDIQQSARLTKSRGHPQRAKKIPFRKALGVSLLPVSRVTRATKQDRDVKIVSKEAVFLVSIATEFFIKKLTKSAFETSSLNHRVFVKYYDIATAVKRNPEYDWLDGVIPEAHKLGTILRDPTIPSSATGLTNKIATELITSLDDTHADQSIPLPQNHPISPPVSSSNLAIQSVHDDTMDVGDQDELDEEL